jgi:transposase
MLSRWRMSERTAAEISELCGIARGHFFRLVARVRKDGLEALLERDKPGPKEGSCRGMDDAVREELAAKLAAGDFTTADRARAWLEEKHGIKRPYQTVWGWLEKAGGVLLEPRPSHSKKDPAAAQVFRDGLADKLEALDLAEGSRVKLWVMDEARFGRPRLRPPRRRPLLAIPARDPLLAWQAAGNGRRFLQRLRS